MATSHPVNPLNTTGHLTYFLIGKYHEIVILAFLNGTPWAKLPSVELINYLYCDRSITIIIVSTVSETGLLRAFGPPTFLVEQFDPCKNKLRTVVVICLANHNKVLTVNCQ